MQIWKKGCVFGHIDKFWKEHNGHIKKNAYKNTYLGSIFIPEKYVFRVCFESPFTRMISSLKYKWPPAGCVLRFVWIYVRKNWCSSNFFYPVILQARSHFADPAWLSSCCDWSMDMTFILTCKGHWPIVYGLNLQNIFLRKVACYAPNHMALYCTFGHAQLQRMLQKWICLFS